MKHKNKWFYSREKESRHQHHERGRGRGRPNEPWRNYGSTSRDKLPVHQVGSASTSRKIVSRSSSSEPSLSSRNSQRQKDQALTVGRNPSSFSLMSCLSVPNLTVPIVQVIRTSSENKAPTSNLRDLLLGFLVGNDSNPLIDSVVSNSKSKSVSIEDSFHGH